MDPQVVLLPEDVLSFSELSAKNQELFHECSQTLYNQWNITSNGGEWDPLSTEELIKIPAKFFVKHKFSIESNNTKITSMIIPIICQGNFRELVLVGQTLSMKELKFLGTSVCDASLFDVKIISLYKYEHKELGDDGNHYLREHSFLDIFEQFPKLVRFNYKFRDNFWRDDDHGSDATKQLLSNKQFNIMAKSDAESWSAFSLKNIPEHFDIFSFYGYLKCLETKMNVQLEFSNTISENYKNDLETINEDISQNWKFYNGYPPLI